MWLSGKKDFCSHIHLKSEELFKKGDPRIFCAYQLRKEPPKCVQHHVHIHDHDNFYDQTKTCAQFHIFLLHLRRWSLTATWFMDSTIHAKSYTPSKQYKSSSFAVERHLYQQQGFSPSRQKWRLLQKYGARMTSLKGFPKKNQKLIQTFNALLRKPHIKGIQRTGTWIYS